MRRLLRRSRWPGLVLLLGLAYTLLLQALVPPGTFVNGDAGLKYLLTRQLAAGELHADLRLPGPEWARRLWEDEQLYPIAYPSVVVHEGRRYALFGLALPALSAPLLRLFGFRGLLLLPLLGCWAIWAFSLQACRALRLGGAAGALTLGALALASPLTFYSATFWEHTPGVALAWGGLVMVLLAPPGGPRPGRALVGGLLLGLAPLLREELFLLAALVAGLATLGLWPRAPRLLAGRAGVVLAGLALGLLAVLAFNTWMYGQPLGLHAETALTTRAWQSTRRALNALASLAPALPAYFPSAGLALLAPFVCRPGRRRAALLLLGLALSLTLVTPVLVRSAGGRQWGPRYLLVAVPMLALCGGAVLRAAGRRRRAVLLLAAALGAWGAWTNLVEGTLYLAGTSARRLEPLAVLGADPVQAVVVARNSIALSLAPLFESKAMFQVRRGSELRGLARGLQAQGQRRFLLLCHASYPCGPLDGLPERLTLRRASSASPLLELVRRSELDRYVLYDGFVAPP